VNTAVLEVSDLHIEIDSSRGLIRAVDGVSMAVGRGEIVGVVGESGCGKSTLLRAIAGVPASRASIVSGTMTVDGVPVRPRKPVDGVAMIVQDPMTGLDPLMKVGHQIAEVPRRRDGVSRRAARAMAIDLMKEVGIADASRRFDAYPHELSGGLRQRVLIAAALSGDPRLLLCDEPTTALDVTVQAQIVRLLSRLREERELAILYVSHDLLLVGELCDRVDVMYAAQIIERGETDAVLAQPRHPYTRGLLQAAPDIARPLDRLVSIPGRPPALTEPLDGCRFAPRCAHAVDRCREATGLGATRVPSESACVRSDELIAVSELSEGLR
jgi:oligopeptide/dipeptide ABC transporter ATP-binding protein